MKIKPNPKVSEYFFERSALNLFLAQRKCFKMTSPKMNKMKKENVSILLYREKSLICVQEKKTSKISSPGVAEVS